MEPQLALQLATFGSGPMSMVKIVRYLCLAAIATSLMIQSVVSKSFKEIGRLSHSLEEATQPIASAGL